MKLLKFILPILLSFILTCTGTGLNGDENEIEKEEQVEQPDDLPGFYADGRHIYDRCGEEVIMHDATGKWDILDEVVDYWLDELLEIVNNYE